MTLPRRNFLKRSSAASIGAFLGAGDHGWLGNLPTVSAAEAKPNPAMVQFGSEIEPVVRLLEDTPGNRVIEVFAERIRKHGLTYQEVLAALLLAGVRNVQPRPSVGFKFHAVLVVNSAHIASMASPDSERWLPIFWALNEFKRSQERDTREGNWTMGSVDESKVPPAHRAKKMFVQAMENWDVEAVDVAVAGLARTAGAHEVFELFAKYGARDFRSIGHKAIYVSNSWRTLQCIGWQHAEPVLRSLAYALLNHNGQPNPSQSDLEADRHGRKNAELLQKIDRQWRGGTLQKEATAELIQGLRSENGEATANQVVTMLNKGVAPQSIYDALLVGAGELLMRKPGIVGLHAVTTTNAMRYAFETVRDDKTRRMILLQNASFLPLFQKAMGGRGKVREAPIENLVAAPKENSVEEICASMSENRDEAAQKLLGYLDRKGSSPDAFLRAARTLIFTRGTNSHDYKFSSAVLEDFRNVSPAWRNQFLATSVYNLRGSGGKDNGLMERTKSAFS